MIDFNIAPSIEKGIDYIKDAFDRHKTCGDGFYTSKCSQWMKEQFNLNNVLLTTSCTHALEMSAILCGIEAGDEVIMPSYTFVSTANAFILRGAKVIFVDIRPDTMNINENLIEAAITKKTKAIVPVHYAGVACEMDKICDIARQHNIWVIEDAAQAVMAYYKGEALGGIGNLGCYSFHETKNFSMGEGGALVFNDNKFKEEAEIIREKGTDRSKFFRGQVDKYTWVNAGSSYLPSDINAAYLFAQFEIANDITNNRLGSWNFYNEQLYDLAKQGKIEQPVIPEYCTHNAHMYYIKVKDLTVRSKLIKFLNGKGVQSVFHYVPLHTSPAGKKFSEFRGEDKFTTKESERLLRLPLYYGIEKDKLKSVVTGIKEFFK